LPSWKSKPSNRTVSLVETLIKSQIDEHKRTFTGDNLRDFMDVFLQEIQDTKDTASSFYGHGGGKELIVAVKHASTFDALTKIIKILKSKTLSYRGTNGGLHFGSFCRRLRNYKCNSDLGHVFFIEGSSNTEKVPRRNR
jgi:hypothetical protein